MARQLIDRVVDTLYTVVDRLNNLMTDTFTKDESDTRFAPKSHRHPATEIDQDTNNRMVPDTKISEWNAKQPALGYVAEDKANKGLASGYAALDTAGKVPVSQLPDLSYNQTKVVANMPARDALTGMKTGDRVIVMNAGDATLSREGFIWDGTSWLKDSDTDWANVNVDWANLVSKPTSPVGEIDTAAAKVKTSTELPTANELIKRDVNGRAQVAAPSAAADIARKDTVDAIQTNLNTHDANTVKHVTQANKDYWNNKAEVSYVDTQISSVSASGVPKLQMYPFSVTATADNQTQVTIPMDSFDSTTDTLLVYKNTVFVASPKYTVTNTVRNGDGTVATRGFITLATGVANATEINIVVLKNVAMGADGMINGKVMQVNSLPIDRIMNTTINDTLVPSTDINNPATLFSNIANVIKGIIGQNGWRSTPRTSLNNAVKLNGDVMTGNLQAPNLQVNGATARVENVTNGADMEFHTRTAAGVDTKGFTLDSMGQTTFWKGSTHYDQVLVRNSQSVRMAGTGDKILEFLTDDLATRLGYYGRIESGGAPGMLMVNNRAGSYLGLYDTGHAVLDASSFTAKIPVAVGSGGLQTVYGAISWSNGSPSDQFAIIINTPIHRTDDRMFRIHVKGFEYGNNAPIDFIVVGYAYSAATGPDGVSGVLTNYSIIDNGTDGLPKSIGINANGYISIAYGDYDSTHYYPALVVDFMLTNSVVDNYRTGWTVTTSKASGFGWKVPYNAVRMNQNLGSNGYTWIGGRTGILMQWGTCSVPTNATTGLINFPFAFPNNVRHLGGIHNQADGRVSIWSLSNSQFNLYGTGASGTIFWFALGN